jgi:hypothetical protein
MSTFGLSQDDIRLISGGLFLFKSGSGTDHTTAISASVPQILAITCSSNYNNRLTKLTTLNAYAIITVTSGSSTEKDTKLVLRYVSSSNQTNLIYSSSLDTLDHLLGGVNTNIRYIDIPLNNNDDSYLVAAKTVNAFSSSIGINTFFSTSFINDSSAYSASLSSSLGINMTIGSSFKIRNSASLQNGVEGKFLIYSLNSGSVANPDFTGTQAQIGEMEVGDTFKVGGNNPVFSYNIIQSGSGGTNQSYYPGNPQTSSATLGIKLDTDKESAIFESPTANSFFKLNNEGNIETTIRSTAGASTGSELILKASRDDDARLQEGDLIGQVRWISTADITDERKGAEAASIAAVTRDADGDGVIADLIFKTAASVGEPAQERLKIDTSGITHITGSVNIDGTLTAKSYIVSASVTTQTSGSTIFGNTSDDTHQFTGSIDLSSGDFGIIDGGSF